MAKLLFPDQDRIRGNKTSAECEYALAMLLNFLAFPKREYSEMAQIWQMDRRAISEYVLVLMDWGVIAGIQSLTRPFNPHPMPHSILCATTRAILKRWYHLLWPGDISRIRANLHKWRRAICSTLRLAEEDYLNVFGFIDGTARRTNRPWGMSIFQQALYDGHHCYHGFDYEGVTSPDGLIIRLFGPVSARHNDMGMVGIGKIQQVVSEEFREETGAPFFLYGDQGYMISPFLLSGKSLDYTLQEKVNNAWSKQRVAVEWSFGRVVSLWQTLNCFLFQQPQRRMVAAWYLVSVFLYNCNICIYKNSEAYWHFGEDARPPDIEEYLRPKDADFVRWARKYRPDRSKVIMHDEVQKWEDWAADHPDEPVEVAV